MTNIKSPIFIIATDDRSVHFLHNPGEADRGDFEAIDVIDGLYESYDSEGQKLKLIVVKEDGNVRKQDEGIFKIPFFGKLSFFDPDKNIKIISTGKYEKNKLIDILTADLSKVGYYTKGLTLNELVLIYQKRYPSLLELIYE